MPVRWREFDEKKKEELDLKEALTDLDDDAVIDEWLKGKDAGGAMVEETGHEEAREAVKFKCVREDLEGQCHPETGVPYVKKEVEVKGERLEVVVPVFDSQYEAQLPEDMIESRDRKQFSECNRQLMQGIEDEDIRLRFDQEQIEQIEDGETPDGFTWHHDAESGRMQLVESDIHQKTRHTGGRAIWGGGGRKR